MSYLQTPRLVFSGDFYADVSTVNNDPKHYDNANFKPSYQLPGAGTTNGWWNPEGGAIFDFRDCAVKQYELTDGTIVCSERDELIGQLVRGAQGRTTGKMVDLDPDQQMCSELWAVNLHISNAAGDLLLSGEIVTTGFRDLQQRQFTSTDYQQLTDEINDDSALEHFAERTAILSKNPSDTSFLESMKSQTQDVPYTQNGQPLGAPWASVLKNVVWGEKAANHPFFKELKETTQGDKVSINLNGFGYYYAHKDDRFSLGRVIGAIGPWSEQDPLTFAPARRLLSINSKGMFGFSNFYLEEDKRRLTFDLGGSFPIANSLGNILFDQELYMGVSCQAVDNKRTFTVTEGEDFSMIGPVNYKGGTNWLLNTGGFVSFNDLSDELLSQLSGQQVLLMTKNDRGEYRVLARESIGGYFARADNFVQRIDSDETKSVNIYAYQWGKPISNDLVISAPSSNPENGLSYSTSFKTDDCGKFVLDITGNQIGTPRDYIDGQIYKPEISHADASQNDDLEYSALINVHLRSYFEVPDNPTWSDIEYTMTQYSNLYPIMSKYLVDLKDPEAVKKFKGALMYAFSLPLEDPVHMPVTRDLSAAKRDTILKWLKAQPEPVPHGEKKLFDRTQRDEEV